MEQMKADPNSKQTKKRLAAIAHNEKMRQNELVGSDRPTDAQREELDALSSKVFSSFNPLTGTFKPGPTSRWQTLLRKGVGELVTEEVTEYVPEEKDEAGNVIKAEETVKHQVPVKYNNAEKSTISKVKRFTVESLLLELRARAEQHDKFVEMIEKHKKEQEEKRQAALLAEQVQNSAGGSTL